MSNNENGSPSSEESEVARAFAEWLAEGLAGGEDESKTRVDRVLARARHEVGARDLLTFALVRVWTALLSITVVFYVLFVRR
jgi:hypothetical protein